MVLRPTPSETQASAIQIGLNSFACKNYKFLVGRRASLWFATVDCQNCVGEGETELEDFGKQRDIYIAHSSHGKTFVPLRSLYHHYDLFFNCNGGLQPKGRVENCRAH
uniref:Uncharacterized protein n=1 Tax=Photinus pyralis TaxID=7054 RepID=A0A1Y1LKM4_PHOPY